MNLIKNLREAAGLSQRDLAKQVGCSRTKVYDVENGRNLKDEDLDKFSKALATSLDLAYVAGLFDRHSSINIIKINPYKIHKSQKSPTYVAKIHFYSKYKLLCDTIKHAMGSGQVCPRKEKKNGPIMGWVYYAHCEAVDNVVDKLLPYIRLKRDRFLLIKDFRKFLEESRDWYRKEYATNGKEMVIKQIPNTKPSWGISLASEATEVARSTLHKWCKEGKVEAQKDESGEWKIRPFYVDSVISNRPTVPQPILDKYEEFFNKIKELP